MILTHLAAFSFFDGAGPILDTFGGHNTAGCLAYFDGVGRSMAYHPDPVDLVFAPRPGKKKRRKEDIEAAVVLLLMDE